MKLRLAILLLLISSLNIYTYGLDFISTSDSILVARHLEKGETHFNQKKKSLDTLALQEFYKALSIQQNIDVHSPQISQIHSRCGAVYYWYSEYKKALPHYLSALEIEKSFSSNSSKTLKLNKVLGQTYALLNKSDSAKYYYGVAEEVSKNFPNSKSTADLMGYIGVYYYHLGDYKQSLNYTSRFLEIYQHHFPEKTDAIFRAKNNLASIYKRQGEFKKSLALSQQLLDETKANKGVKEITQLVLYQNLGVMHNKLGNFDKGIKYLEIALSKYDAQIEIDATIAFRLYENMGMAYKGLGKLESALVYFKKAIEINQKYFDFNNVLLAGAYKKRAEVLMEMGQTQKAMEEIQQALVSVVPGFSSLDPTTNPEPATPTLSDRYTFQILLVKARLMEESIKLQKDYFQLPQVLDCYRLAMELGDKIRKGYHNDEAKLFFLNEVSPVFEESIRVSLQLYAQTQDESYKELAFNFSEQNKAAVLKESINDQEIKSFAGIPNHLLAQEKDLKIQISRLKNQLGNAKSQGKIDKLKSKLASLEIELSKVIQSFEAYPQYYALKYARDEINLKALQHQLAKDEKSLLEYFWGEKEIIGFLVTPEALTIKRFPLNPELKSNIDQYLETCQNYKSGEPFVVDHLSHQIYKQLFHPFENNLNDSRRLVIVPDGKLNYLPFDAFMVDLKVKRYLIENFSISQSSSAKLWLDAKQTSVNPKNEILAMAPFAGDQGHEPRLLASRENFLSPLPASRQEVSGITNSFYLNEQATKQEFLNTYQQYSVLHFATHASVNEEDPSFSYITFFPTGNETASAYKLFVHELYNLKFDSTKLVVLSGCETGSGQFQRGEGIMSLARAIAYAGCPNIMMTLWRAEDKSTSFIAQKMYAYLMDGLPKDEALRQAKLDYLQSDEFYKIDKTPVHWANFILIGNTDPILEKGINRPKYWIISTGLAMGITFMFFKRKRPRKAKS
ncbi:CHAT domain-containing protein [Flexithrix dorotheae]|uniref:CHAT domain-containing protein n=1 Tax=Flexithrix dorotheae TaxID=70993 RepID=UPI0003659CBB|nr:CHAT domain-containing tetratricopeptide repeat protein [Flexithrix dorotheae]